MPDDYRKQIRSMNGICACEGISDLRDLGKRILGLELKCNNLKDRSGLNNPRPGDKPLLLNYGEKAVELNRLVMDYYDLIRRKTGEGSVKLYLHEEGERTELSYNQALKILGNDSTKILSINCASCGQQLALADN